MYISVANTAIDSFSLLPPSLPFPVLPFPFLSCPFSPSFPSSPPSALPFPCSLLPYRSILLPTPKTSSGKTCPVLSIKQVDLRTWIADAVILLGAVFWFAFVSIIGAISNLAAAPPAIQVLPVAQCLHEHAAVPVLQQLPVSGPATHHPCTAALRVRLRGPELPGPEARE